MDNTARDLPAALTTTADVTAMWRDMMQPLGWSEHRLYAVMLGSDRRPLWQVLQVDEMPRSISAADAAGFMGVFAHLIGVDGFADVTGIAVLWCRPGSGGPAEADRASCHRLYEAARERSVPMEVVHVGTASGITPAPMDEVLPRSA